MDFHRQAVSAIAELGKEVGKQITSYPAWLRSARFGLSEIMK